MAVPSWRVTDGEWTGARPSLEAGWEASLGLGMVGIAAAAVAAWVSWSGDAERAGDCLGDGLPVAVETSGTGMLN